MFFLFPDHLFLRLSIPLLQFFFPGYFSSHFYYSSFIICSLLLLLSFTCFLFLALFPVLSCAWTRHFSFSDNPLSYSRKPTSPFTVISLRYFYQLILSCSLFSFLFAPSFTFYPSMIYFPPSIFHFSTSFLSSNCVFSSYLLHWRYFTIRLCYQSFLRLPSPSLASSPSFSTSHPHPSPSIVFSSHYFSFTDVVLFCLSCHSYLRLPVPLPTCVFHFPFTI